MSSRALLRVKRRRSEDPYEALMISCQPKRSRGSNLQYQTPLQRAAAEPPAPTRSAGGDYEGAEYSDHAPPLPVVSKVFHLAGTVGAAPAAARDQAKLIEEIRVKGKPSKKPVITSRPSVVDNRRTSSKSSVNNNNDDVADNCPKKGASAFKAVLKNQNGAESEMKLENEGNSLKIFDVVKTEVRAVDELDAEYRVGGSGDITCNDVPVVREDVADGAGCIDDFVYDLYYSTAEGAEAKLDLSFLDAYLDVKPYRNEDLDTLENYGIVEPASMLQRGFLGVEDEDSNDEDNWRNDYPDSDPEDAFDREEPDYDQCGFIHDAVEEDEYASANPIGPGRDEYLSDMLRIGMRLRNDYGEDEGDDEEDQEDADQWDVGNPKESQAYLEYKRRTMTQLNMRDDDDDDEEDDEDGIDVYGEGMGIGGPEVKLNLVAYDEKLDKDSESDSFDNYDEDEGCKDI